MIQSTAFNCIKVNMKREYLYPDKDSILFCLEINLSRFCFSSLTLQSVTSLESKYEHPH